MANRRATARNNRRNRRRTRQKKRRQQSGIHSTVTVNANCLRSFAFYCPNYAATVGASVKSWLESIVKYGTIMLKIFTFIISVTNVKKVTESKHVITGAVQSLFIGVEDVLFSSPLVERELKDKAQNVKVSVPCIDFRSARMPTASISITPGSAMKDRSGRYCAVLLPITEEEYQEYVPSTYTGSLATPDAYEFKDLLQMPGAKIAPFGRAMNLKWRAHPTSYAYRFLQIGQKWKDGVDPDKNVVGGKPSFRLMIGFQDFASSDGNTTNLYSASNAVVHVDIRARVQLTEPVTEFSGRRYIRDWPQVTQNAKVVTCYDENGTKTDIDRDKFYVYNGELKSQVATKDDVVTSPGGLDLDSMALE